MDNICKKMEKRNRKKWSFIELKWNILLEEGIQTMKRGLNMQEESNPHMGEMDNLIGEPNSEECDFFMYEKYVLIGLSYKYKHSESIDEVEGSFAFRRPPRREFFVSALKP